MLRNVRREWVDMLKILVISYKSTILRVHRSVLLKYLRFPDQHIKRNSDTPKDTGYPKKSYTTSHCPRNEPIIHLYTIFDCFVHDLGWGGGEMVCCCVIFHDFVQDCSSMGCSYYLMIFWLKISMPG